MSSPALMSSSRTRTGFEYGNTSTSMYYRGSLAGQAPIPAGKTTTRVTQNVSTVIDLEVDKVITNPGFFARYVVRDAELDTSGSTMVGDVILQKIFKLHATLVR